MIQWVYEAAQGCDVMETVVVATDDKRIAKTVREFGGIVEMTDNSHQTGTDRVAEVARRRAGYEVVVNVQGDQPFVTAAMLKSLVRPYLDGDHPEMTTLGCPLAKDAAHDPNIVKAVCDIHMNALYFSRAPIPFYRQVHPAPVYHHLGLYAFSGRVHSAVCGHGRNSP